MLPFSLGLPGFHVIYFWFVGARGFRVISGLPFPFVLLFWVCMIFFLRLGTFLPLLQLAGVCCCPSAYLLHFFGWKLFLNFSYRFFSDLFLFAALAFVL